MSSTTSRLVSGTLSAWLRILLTIATQLAVTPIFLSHWSVEEYGYWLLFQAITPLVQLVDTGHQTYIGYECLKIGVRRRKLLSVTTSSAIACCWLTGACTIAIVTTIALLARFGVFGTTAQIFMVQWHMGTLLIVHSFVWALTGSVSCVITRMLSCFGHFARFSWWGVVMQLVNTFVPVVVVVLGYGIESAGLALLLGTFCVNLLLINDALALCRRYRIALNRPSWDVGLRNLYHSLVVSLSAVCDLLRAQGVRLLLAPLGGAREVAAFSITRTGANLALQGIATITQPLMPELLSFVRARDQVRVESAFALVWLILLSIVNPAVLLLQWLGSPIFSIWTRGKVAFDPLLFAFLISDILIFALAQPAMAVVQGNNLTRIQFKTSLFSGILTLIGIYFSMQVAGIRGAAAVLAMVEIVVLTVYVFVAWKWFADVRMRWPWSSFAVVLFSVAITIAALLCMAAGGPIWIWMAVAIVLQYIAVYHYYSRLPEIGKRRLAKLISAPITLLRRNSQRQSPLL